MQSYIGMMALVGDVWYQIMDERTIIDKYTGKKKTEYWLYSKDYWIPKSWIKDVKVRI